ncbi:hypothetical protein LTR53_012607, partial [Teratosphaeriaceae sp. CCFEE 6253]
MRVASKVEKMRRDMPDATMPRSVGADDRGEEGEAPPVPRKDTPKHGKMNGDTAPPSASKRKRDDHDDTIYDMRDGWLEAADLDAHTPKRSRQSDTEGSEGTPGKKRHLRRKEKINNLSHVSLRQAAEQQRQRESKFQEGSLNDRPSMKPPSAFTRMIRTESGNIKQVDELMEGYNDDTVMPDVSLVGVTQGDAAMSLAGFGAQPIPKAESGGFFRFGRPFANFHPVTLWNKMWNESREELIRQHNEEEERKRRQKEEAEAKYAQMKAAGQLGLKPVGRNLRDIRESAESSRPRDSAIVLEGVPPSITYDRVTSTGSQLLPPPRDDVSNHSGSEAQEAATKTKGIFRSRFTFKKPSVSNLKGGLKRVASDLNLTSTTHLHRESSSSISPVKANFEYSTLQKSSSKVDLKKQYKLSKRVSNLESKLQVARRELGEALIEASPAPKISGKYERFTPGNTIKRPKFVPGKLPSLPSERVLMAEQLGFGDDELSPDMGMFGTQVTGASNISELVNVGDVGDTIKTESSSLLYPRRADSLFKLSDDRIDLASTTKDTTKHKMSETAVNEANEANVTTSELTELTSESIDMGPNATADLMIGAAPPAELAQSGGYASLDAKLRALDKQVKLPKKPAGKSKKRKSGAKDDATFRPTTTTDDEGNWQEANGTPRKKRKSSGNVTST